jgi:hypothetical protein
MDVRVSSITHDSGKVSAVLVDSTCLFSLVPWLVSTASWKFSGVRQGRLPSVAIGACFRFR